MRSFQKLPTLPTRVKCSKPKTLLKATSLALQRKEEKKTKRAQRDGWPSWLRTAAHGNPKGSFSGPGGAALNSKKL